LLNGFNQLSRAWTFQELRCVRKFYSPLRFLTEKP
jgi:hypothetical protein